MASEVLVLISWWSSQESDRERERGEERRGEKKRGEVRRGEERRKRRRRRREGKGEAKKEKRERMPEFSFSPFYSRPHGGYRMVLLPSVFLQP
jgi:hypothetical protein